MNNLNQLLGDNGKSREATCDTHGPYQSHHLLGRTWSKCPACSADLNAREKAEQEVRECEKQRVEWERRVCDAGIPERFRTRTLNSFVADSDEKRYALEFATRYANDFDDVFATGRSALFLGKPGTGKTHLAAGIGLRTMESGYSVLFTTTMRAIRRVKDTWGRSTGETETEAVAALVYPDLLILDEVGVQFGSDTEKLITFDILNERYERRRPTLLLSNHALQDVKAFLGERIFDRLREDGGAVVSFGWESHRGTG
jgi:DNA replication protein DnaC